MCGPGPRTIRNTAAGTLTTTATGTWQTHLTEARQKARGLARHRDERHFASLMNRCPHSGRPQPVIVGGVSSILTLLVGIAAWVAFFGGIGYAIGDQKDRGGAGFLLGILLGVIGWIIVGLMEPSESERLRRNHQLASSLRGEAAVIDPNFAQMSARDRARAKALGRTTRLVPTSAERSCPWCAESIKAAAVICRFCSREVQPLTAAERVMPGLATAPAAVSAAMVYFSGELVATQRRSLGGQNRDRDDDALMGAFDAPGRPWDQRAQGRYQTIVDEALTLGGDRDGWSTVDGLRLPAGWVDHYDQLADLNHGCPALVSFIESSKLTAG